MRTFAEFARQGRDNNFNLIRMTAASAVLVSHSFFIATAQPFEPLESSTPFKLGTQGVIVFFAISGYLIAASFIRRISVIDFTLSRVARIVPGLAGMTAFVALVLVPALGSLPLADYYAHPNVWLSLIGVPTFLHFAMEYPGLFPHNPAPSANGSLWSLPYEIACYGATMVLGSVGLLHARRYVPLFAIAVLVLVVGRLCGSFWAQKHVIELMLSFALGILFYVARERLPLNGWIAALLVALTMLLRDSVLYRESYILALSYGTFYLAGIRSAALAYNRIGDYSYGLYIFAWPIQESVVAVWHGIDPIPLAVAAWLVTLPFAIASWHLIEHPSLVHRHRIGIWLTRLVGLAMRRNRSPA